MKKIIILNFLAIVFLTQFTYAYNCYFDGEKIVCQKYNFKGDQVWSDKQMKDIIEKWNSISSNTVVTENNFVNVFPSAFDIALTTTVLDISYDGEYFYGLDVDAFSRITSDKMYLKYMLGKIADDMAKYKNRENFDESFNYENEKKSILNKRVWIKKKIAELP